jgi:integrase
VATDELFRIHGGSMAYTKKRDAKGNTYYSFMVYDSKLGKNVRLKKSEIQNRFGRDISTEKEAREIESSLKAEYDSAKERFKRQLDWQNKYYSFKSLLDKYTELQKRKSPYGFKNSVHYLKYYVLPYFLNIAQNNNINNWHLSYRKFRIWLEDEASLVRDPNKRISYSSKNHAVKSLNTFMRHLKNEGIINQLHICEAFDESKLNEKSIDDVVTEEESWIVYKKLRELNYHNEAEYFLMLYWTGMRFNEGLGISLGDIYKGEISRDSLKNLLRRNLIFYKDEQDIPNEYLFRYFGFITLSSQPDNGGSRSIVRDKYDQVLRKPLKMKKAINERNTRIVPIVCEELWEVLSRRAKREYKRWKNNHHLSSNKSDYLLFEGITASTSMLRLKEAYEKSNLKYRSWHCCRHSRGTFLHGKTGDKELSMQWLGHASEKVHSKYLHTYEGLMREIKAKDMCWDE